MILDKLMQFDAAGSLASTIVGAGVVSGNVLDLLNARDIGVANDNPILVVVFTIGTAFAASGGASSLRIELQAAPDSSGSPGTYRTISRSDDIPKANLTAGQVIRLAFGFQASNPLLTALPRFLRCFYTGVTNDFTSGTFECDLVGDPQANNPPAYPAGFTVAN